MTGTVLLTGATGLIGRHCAAPLRAAGFEVLNASRSGKGGIALDLLDGPAMRAAIAQHKPGHLIHLAWHDGPNRYHDPANLDWAKATLDLMRAFRDAGGTRAVCVGSCAEYDWSAGPVFDEAAPLAPASLYGAAKVATAKAIANLDGLPSHAWARVFFCYGPFEPKGRLLGDLISGLRAGAPVDCTDGQQARDFLHVADIAEALVAILQNNLTGPVNIGAGQATAVKTLIGEVAAQMNRPDLIRLGARPRPADDPAEITADVTRLRKATGWTPRLDLATGIRDVLSHG